MNLVYYLVMGILVLWTVLWFRFDWKAWWNTGSSFGEGFKMPNTAVALIGYNPVKPRKNYVLQDAQKFTKWDNYALSFTIKPLSKQGGWRGIIHNSMTGGNCCHNYERWPGIWFFSGTTRMHIRWQNNKGVDPSYHLPLGQKSTVTATVNNATVRVVIRDENGNTKFDQSSTLSAHNPPVNPSSQKFYMCGPWYEAADVEITELILDSNVSNPTYKLPPTLVGTGSVNWKHIPGKLKNVSSNLKGDVWGVNSADQIYRRDPGAPSWKRVSGGLAQISAGDKNVYGVNSGDSIYRMPVDGTGGWKSIGGKLKNISGSGAGWVWGVNRTGNIYKCKKPCGTTHGWSHVPGGLKQISGGQNEVWGVNSGDDIYKRPVDGTGNWKRIGGKLKWVSASNPDYIYGVNSADDIYKCKKPCTGGWSRVGGKLKQISVGQQVWGVNSGDNIYSSNYRKAVPMGGSSCVSQFRSGKAGEKMHGPWFGGERDVRWVYDECCSGGIALCEDLAGGGYKKMVKFDKNGDTISDTGRYHKNTGAYAGWPSSGTQLQAWWAAGKKAPGLNYQFKKGPNWKASCTPAAVGGKGNPKWKQIPGKLKNVSSNLKGDVWGVNSSDQIYRRDPGAPSWKRVSGGLAQISAGDKNVYGVNSGDSIYRMPVDGTGGWKSIGGKLKNISGSGSGWVWGVNRAGNIYKCKKPCGTTHGWSRVPGGLKQISGGQNEVWGVNSADDIYKRPVDGTGNWKRIGGKLKWVSASNPDYIYGVNSTDTIYKCKKPCTGGWSRVPGKLKQISGGQNEVWGVNTHNNIYSGDNGTAVAPPPPPPPAAPAPAPVPAPAPPPPPAPTQVCITPQQLNTASTTMNWFTKFFGQSKCVDGKALDQAVTAARGDLLAAAADPKIASELKKAEPHLKAAEPYLKAASEQGKPHYQAAAKKAMPFLKKAFAGLGEKGASTQARLAPVQTAAAAPVQTAAAAPVQTAAAAAAPQQNINKWRGPLSVIIKPGSGFCPNGCKPPQYDNPTCVNEVYEGRGYRNCPWLGDGSIENSSCGTCGAILMPKNKYGYARTRPGLFDNVSLDNAVSRSTEATDPKNIDHEKIGRTFMNELARTKDFSLPFISKREFESVGRIVSKYELEGGASRKKTLTDTINNVLNTSNLPSQLLNNRKRSLAGDDGDDGSRGGGGGAIGKRLSADDLYSQKESKLESQSDNRLGGGSTAYKANYKPVDPRKGPRPYDSVWDIFRQ